MALNNGTAPKTTKTQPTTKPVPAKPVEVATLAVVLAVGASYSYGGQRYVPDVVYDVDADLGDFLLSLKAHGETDQFREVTRKDATLERVRVGSSVKAQTGETAEDLAEIQAHLDGGAKTSEEAAAGGDSGTGEGKQETTIE